MSLEDGTRYIVPKRRLLTTSIRCMTSQKSDDLRDPKYSHLVCRISELFTVIRIVPGSISLQWKFHPLSERCISLMAYWTGTN